MNLFKPKVQLIPLNTKNLKVTEITIKKNDTLNLSNKQEVKNQVLSIPEKKFKKPV